MFDKTQYVIKGSRLGVRDTYNVEDVAENLKGTFEKQSLNLGPELVRLFGFKGTDETSLGEIREVGSGEKTLGFMGLVDRYEVYDGQNRLRGTLKPEEHSDSEKRQFRIGIILLVAGGVSVVGTLLASLLLNLGDLILTVGIFGGFALVFFGLIYMVYMAVTGKLGMQKWNIQSPEGVLWAQAGQSSKYFAEYQITASDGTVIAQIRKERGLSQLIRSSYRITVSRQELDPLLILCYAVLMANKERQQRQMGY